MGKIIGSVAVCERCSGQYIVTGQKQRFCPACAFIRRRETIAIGQQRKIAGNSQKIGSAAICERCGAEYTKTGGNQKYCPACSRSRWNGASARHVGSYVPCKRCGELFELTAPGQAYCPACAAIKQFPRSDSVAAGRDAFVRLFEKYNITKSDFSKRFGIDISLISRWYTGERKCSAYIIKMADELLAIDAERKKEEPT